MKISDGTIQEDDKQKKDKLPFVVLMVLLLFCVVGTAFFLNGNNINLKKIGINSSTNVYNEAFDNGVNCGVDALMFFVKQGKKEIDINEVYNKAQEIRKQQEQQKEGEKKWFHK